MKARHKTHLWQTLLSFPAMALRLELVPLAATQKCLHPDQGPNTCDSNKLRSEADGPGDHTELGLLCNSQKQGLLLPTCPPFASKALKHKRLCSTRGLSGGLSLEGLPRPWAASSMCPLPGFPHSVRKEHTADGLRSASNPLPVCPMLQPCLSDSA